MTEFKILTSDLRDQSLRTIASGGMVDTASLSSGGFPPVFDTQPGDHGGNYFEYNCITVDPTDASNVTEHVSILYISAQQKFGGLGNSDDGLGVL